MMKKIITTHLFMLMALLFVSCDDSESNYETPQFRLETQQVEPEGESIKLHSSNNLGWWFSGVTINNEFHLINPEEFKLTYFDGSNKIIDLYMIESDWFTIHKISGEKINVSVDANHTGKTRTFSFKAQLITGYQEISFTQRSTQQ